MWPLIGNELLVSYLRRSLEKDALSQAYLFSGPPHVGKMTLALMLAQAVNCAGQEKPCGECNPCQKVAGMSHPDIMIIKLLTADESEDKKDKNEIVIDQIRKLQHWANLPPFEGRYRVFIFEKAELMNEESANCLLKTLEEPLPGVLFILLSADKSLLAETVLSRCQHLELRPVPEKIIEEFALARGLAPARACLLAKLSGGTPGWVVNAIETEHELTERSERVNVLLDLISQGYDNRFELVETLNGKGAQGRIEAAEFLRQWQSLWRDLLLASSGRLEEIKNLDFKEKLSTFGFRLGLVEIAPFADRLSKAIRQVKLNANIRLVIEMLMLEMPRLDKAHMKR
jgi:DNA polymerase-3 subunit delta'